MSSKPKSSITLKGSAQMITEFFDYGINTILYQRGIYPAESFCQIQKYEMTLLMSTNEEVKSFIRTILNQLQKFLLTKSVHKLVLVIVDVKTRETLERWDFKIELSSIIENNNSSTEISDEEIKEIQKGIRNVIRQITASVSFLPLIDTLCCFDILLYTDKNTCLPSDQWSDGKPHPIVNEERVLLNSVNTNIHKVGTSVAYKGS